jgi:hypothetical protein
LFGVLPVDSPQSAGCAELVRELPDRVVETEVVTVAAAAETSVRKPRTEFAQPNLRSSVPLCTLVEFGLFLRLEPFGVSFPSKCSAVAPGFSFLKIEFAEPAYDPRVFSPWIPIDSNP